MPLPEPALVGRLLCASSCAYLTSEGEPVLDPAGAAPYYSGVEFKSPPAAFIAGEDDIDSCIVGTTGEGVLVAFRGTLSLDGPFSLQKLLDWVNDINARPVPGDGLPGEVHEGFLGSLNSLWPVVRDEAKSQLARAGTSTRLLVTGHSKGGAVAALAAMRFLKQESIAPTVVTFAAPKAGNTAFADAYNAVMDHTRYEFGEDVVPHLPPSTDLFSILSALPFLGSRLSSLQQYDYGWVGSLLYINRALQIIPDPNNNLLPERRKRILDLILAGHLQQIEDDHRIACGYGYMTALVPQLSSSQAWSVLFA
jgi:Lipase (class 3)